jgi:hypothetical protein
LYLPLITEEKIKNDNDGEVYTTLGAEGVYLNKKSSKELNW